MSNDTFETLNHKANLLRNHITLGATVQYRVLDGGSIMVGTVAEIERPTYQGQLPILVHDSADERSEYWPEITEIISINGIDLDVWLEQCGTGSVQADGELPRFWIVWSPTADMPPTRQFTSKSQARRVARIMAEENPGQAFSVLEAQASFKVPPAEVVETRFA